MYGAPGPLIPNPIGRYATGDRTPGLHRATDGSLTIMSAASQPDCGATNWLPSPADEFHLMLRLYWPGPDVLSGTWTPPPVTRLPARPRSTTPTR